MIVPENENPARRPLSTGGAQVAHNEDGAGIEKPEAIPITNLFFGLKIHFRENIYGNENSF